MKPAVPVTRKRMLVPVSEVRDPPQHTLTRTSETRALATHRSSAAFDLKFPTEFAAGCRNFRSAARAQSAAADEIRCEARGDVVGKDLGGAALGVVHAAQPGKALLPERIVGYGGGGVA